MNREATYQKLPIPLQHLACSLEGWRVNRNRYSRSFWNTLRVVEERTFWSSDRIVAYRHQRLQMFIRHCAQTVPYYRRLFREHGVAPEDIKTLDDLQRLPILTKAEVQAHYSELLSEAIPPDQRIISHTSGTTGAGLRFATTVQAQQEQWAIWWRFRRWHRIPFDAWSGYFGGRPIVPIAQTQPPFWRYNVPGKQIRFSAYHMSPERLDAYVAELRRRRPPWLHGHPSLVALVAQHIVETAKPLGYAVRWITLSAENLLPHQVNAMENAFGVKPLQQFGMAEGVANLSECDQGNLHVDEDFAALEFVPSSTGAGYKMIGTNFTNFATPLVRYDAQDIVTLPPVGTRCACGRPGRLIAGVDGRVDDYVILKNGRWLGRMDNIFKDMMNIREAQIIQPQVGQLVYRIVRGEHYGDADETTLLHETNNYVGDNADIHIEYVDALPRSRSGKLRFVISEIPQAQLVTQAHE